MALGVFWIAEKAEGFFGRGVMDSRPIRLPLKLYGAGGLAFLALLVMGMGQPTPLEKWEILSRDKGGLLEDREVYIHPGELVQVAANRQLKMIVLDVRNERDFNLFHLLDSRRVEMDDLAQGALSKELLDEPANTVVILLSNEEDQATRGWKMLMGEGIMNLYILEGGINGWLDLFAEEGACPEGCQRKDGPVQAEELAWSFSAALGANRPIANPDLFTDKAFDFTPKVNLETKARPAGGCG